MGQNKSQYLVTKERRKKCLDSAKYLEHFIGYGDTGRSIYTDLGLKYEAAGKPLHAAKFYLLGGNLGFANWFVKHNNISESRFNLAKLSAVKTIETKLTSDYLGEFFKYAGTSYLDRLRYRSYAKSFAEQIKLSMESPEKK